MSMKNNHVPVLIILSLVFGWQPSVVGQRAQPPQVADRPVVTCESTKPNPRSEIRVDTRGTEFGPWIRAFLTQVKGQWVIPGEYRSATGCTIVSFKVLKDGSVDALTVENPSATEALTNFAYSAIAKSAPFERLPSEFPEEFARFTVTFFYNPGPDGQRIGSEK